MVNQVRRVVIVGARHGGGTVAALLRQSRFDGEVVLLGAEPIGPYRFIGGRRSLVRGRV